MKVVRVINSGIKAERTAMADVNAISFDGAFVREDSIMILTYSHVNVAGHVDKVTRRWRIMSQAIGGRQTVFGIRPGLDRVNIEMVRARMVRVARHDKAQRGKDFLRLGFGCAI